MLRKTVAVRLSSYLSMLALGLLASAPVFAETFTVTNTDNNGAGSLRAAVFAANGAAGEDLIVFDLPGDGPHVIALANTLPTITESVAVVNDRVGDERVTVELAPTTFFRILTINAGAVVTLGGLSFSNGNVTAVSGTTGPTGGAIRNQGHLIARNCTFSGNRAKRGGAIANAATLSVLHCTFTGNSAAEQGGAIYNIGPNFVQVRNSTFSENSAGQGGGILSENGFEMANCTFSGNSATQGGAVFGFFDIRAANTIFRRGASGSNIGGAFASQGNNLSDDNAGGDGGTVPGGELDGPGDIRNTDPRLAPLAANGGFTFTHALVAGSPAIDAGNDERAPVVDQRNYTRAGLSDIGAFEFGGSPAPPATPQTRTVTNLNDSGAGSLRRAVAMAADGDTIAFAQDVTGVLTLTSGELLIDKSVTIQGPGAGTLAIDANNASRVMNISNRFAPRLVVAISALTMRGGRVMSAPNSGQQSVGGGIYNRSVLTLRDCAVTGNTAVGPENTTVGASSVALGGGIESLGELTLINTVVSGNSATARTSASGAGLSHSGRLTLAGSTILNNVATGGNAIGAGVHVSGFSGSPFIATTTVISGNSAKGADGGSAPGTTGDGGNGFDAIGAGIHAARGTIELSDCTVSGNAAVAGNGGNGGSASGSGGIGGAALGGGLFTGAATETISRCTFSGNSARGGRAGSGGFGAFSGAGSGGAMHIEAGAFSLSAVLVNSTISGNSAEGGGAVQNRGNPGSGGGISLRSGTLTTKNSTIVNNTATGDGGDGLSNTVLSRGGGLFIQNSSGAVALLQNTIVARGQAGSGPDIFGGVDAGSSFNLIGDGTDMTGATNGSSGNQVGTRGAPIDPRLGPLQNNGGPTPTHALLSGSPAINTGSDANAPATDQRGYSRSGASDIGAFEFGGTAPPSAGFANLSTRLRVETGDNVLIGGFIVTGSEQKKIIVRAIGPSLRVEGRLANPLLELYTESGDLITSNDDWQDAPNRQEIIDSTVAPSNNLESSILREVPLGAYTAVVRDVAGGAGVGLVEVFDLGSSQNSKLANISTRGRVQTGDDVMIGGLILTGSAPQRVMVRAIAPSLDIAGKLLDPALELYDQNGTLLQSNDNWRSDQEAEIRATTIPPPHEAESAIVRTLTPAPYTAVLRGVNDTTGVALVEVYALQ